MKQWWRRLSAGNQAPQPMAAQVSILMVCMGNICRSPTAHAVMQQKLSALGWSDAVHVDSAGTHAWHVGHAPDPRAMDHAARRGYDLSPLRARGVEAADFARFDLILVMDDDNLAALKKRCPAEHLHKLALLITHAQRRAGEVSVPDPYYGGPNGFEQVLDLVEDACDGVIAYLRTTLPLASP